MSNRTYPASHGEVGELAEFAIDVLKLLFQLVEGKVVEIRVLCPHRSAKQECREQKLFESGQGVRVLEWEDILFG